MADRIIKKDLELERGDTWRVLGSFTVAGANFSGCTVAMQLRSFPDDVTPFSFTISNIVTSPSTSLTFVATMAKATTATIPPGNYSYDVEVTYSDTTSQTIAKGALKVFPDTTR